MRKSLIISIVLILIPISVFARYNYSVKNIKVSAVIAEPIIRIENIDEKITTDFYKNTVKEYKFKIRNYYEIGKNTRISEIPFYYTIEIVLSNPNFPAKYEILNTKGENVLPDNTLKTSSIFIEENEIYEEEYKLIVSWNEGANLSSSVDANILIKAMQYKET